MTENTELSPERGRDGLREAIEALAVGALVEWAGESADLDDCREAAALVAQRFVAAGVQFAEHPATGDEERGRCGSRAPLLTPAGVDVYCRLPHGHGGWHKGDDGSEWTPASDVDTGLAANAAAGGAEGLADLSAIIRDYLTNETEGYLPSFHATALTARIASDWLAAHVAQAKDDERERIAQAIEAQESCGLSDRGHDGCFVADSLRIARGGA